MRSWRTWLPPDPGGEAGGPQRAVAGSRACSVERRSGSSSCGGKTGLLVKDHLRPTLCSPELSLWAVFSFTGKMPHGSGYTQHSPGLGHGQRELGLHRGTMASKHTDLLASVHMLGNRF